jgi:LysM repeat protein
MKRLAATIIAIIIIVGITATPAYAQSSGVYIVQPGDTLLKIAARHSITVSQLAEANGLRWNAWIYAGQRLVIPTDTVYIVRRGDTLSRIARRYATTVRAITQLNGLRSTRIYPGQRLLIPGSRPGSSPVQDTVEGWEGRIVNTPPGSQHAYTFERADGVGFGIGGVNDLVGRQIDDLRWTGERFLVWGRLRTDVPSYGGQHIVVESLEVVSAPSAESRNLTPLATVSVSSHLPTDRWGQYQAWMATDGALGTAWVEGVAGSGTGEWIELRFPGTVEIHAIRMDVGYDKSADVFYKNNRIKRVALVFSTGERVELELADSRGMQQMVLARAPGPAIETTSVKVVIEDVVAGWKYDDTCLAEIEVWGRTR